ncbi:MAG: FHA domain-containing protein, partial [Planctomycetota bacterium]|nr:FHA domain-containing protein [Planctomycetota bacterium]
KRWDKVTHDDTDKWGLPAEFLKAPSVPQNIPARRPPSKRLPRRPLKEDTKQIRQPARRRPPSKRLNRQSPPKQESSPELTPVSQEPEQSMALLSPFLGDPFPIGPRDHVVIGRGQKCTLLFPIKAISRRHAEIFFDNESFILRDLESTNGTYLNGKKVTETPLVDGDQLTIGPFEIIVTSTDPSKSKIQKTANLMDEDTRVTNTMPWTVTADLNHITVAEIAQVLELNCRSGQLVFQTPGKSPGLLVFSEGRITHGEYLDQEPREAVIALLRVSEGWVNFLAATDLPFEKTINDATSLLLFEAARRSDEEARERGEQSPS